MTFASRTTAVFVVAALVAAVVVGASYVRFTSIGSAMNDLTRALMIGRVERDTLLALVDEETEMRGYIATGERRYVGSERGVRARCVRLLDQLRAQIDEPRYFALAGAAHAEIARDVALMDAGRSADARTALAAGSTALAKFRAVDRRVEDDQVMAVAQQRDRVARAIAAAETTLVLGAVALVVLAAASIALARRGRAIAIAAMRDPLTGLRNRRAFEDELRRRIADGEAFALLFIDLDRFKHVNDTHGHLIGDRVLAIAAERLDSPLRDGDLLARIGGDEFAAVVDGTRDHSEAMLAADRVRNTLGPPIVVDRIEVEIGASVGIATYPTDGEDAATLIGVADRAMYRAKTSKTGVASSFIGTRR